jgi:hypothetical protein
LEKQLETFNDKEIFPFFFTYHFINFQWLHIFSSGVGLYWYTQPLSEKRPRDAATKFRFWSSTPLNYRMVQFIPQSTNHYCLLRSPYF